jgi:hypothetical protein
MVKKGFVQWKENIRDGKETFYGDCIKNRKESPDKCIPLSNECDHKKKLVEEDCVQCENFISEVQDFLMLLEEAHITIAELVVRGLIHMARDYGDKVAEDRAFLIAAASVLNSRETN